MLPSHKSLYLELEETFLKIISALPMSDAQELLQQCLSFSTRNVEDCPHLVTPFNTWFRPKPKIFVSMVLKLVFDSFNSQYLFYHRFHAFPVKILCILI
ncbi:hypothetical protein LOK49_LG10G01227 [Camellia lanceoleosa]|uniref:Uncharacterized protein n=1 Tax=Camellia lanceoleosa TaxID=1840588 RepID=A0ACC0G9H2_9ERIC|nr:hypothetical protein LOK49_LG10G01227 [Camellia lanceoleosa]